MKDHRTEYLPQDDAITALLRDAHAEAADADPNHADDTIAQILVEMGLHRDRFSRFQGKPLPASDPPPAPTAFTRYARLRAGKGGR